MCNLTEVNMGTEDLGAQKSLPSNESLVEGAGTVKLEPAQMWGKGIVNDIKRTVGTHWFAEMTNLNQKTIAVSLLMFISVIAPTLTFGAVYGKITNNNIGAVETILATAYVGVVYSLIGGMPMCIIGSTGPVLALSTSLVGMAESFGVPYLTLNFWVSVWLVIYCVLCAFFNATRYIQLATRFTDEIFAMLIVIIFVMDSVGDPFSGSGLLRYIQPDHGTHKKFADDPTYDYMTTALLSIILGFGTCSLIFWFRSFKFSSYFCGDGIRTSIHDFAVSMSVLAFTLIKNLGFPNVQTEALAVPNRFEPSFQCCTETCDMYWPTDCPDVAESWGTRPWIVNIFDFRGKGYIPFVAAGPAVMAFLLCYLDCGITWHLINHKHNKLTHGEAYDYDLILVAFFNCFNSLLGLPWLVATTVPCMIHLASMADKDTHGHIIRVQQTRLTYLFSHILLGSCLAFLPVLKLLPMPVLYGVFLFMGLSSLPGIEFWNRCLLWFQQPSKYPETVFIKYMETKRIHYFTLWQCVFFSGIFVIMNTPGASIIFPFMTFLCLPARLFFLPKFFAGWELLVLDGDQDKIEEWVNAKVESMRGFDEKNDQTGRTLVQAFDGADSDRMSSRSESIIEELET